MSATRSDTSASCCAFSSGMVAGMSGVQTGPGATTLTRIPFSAPSWASALEKVTMAPFVLA